MASSQTNSPLGSEREDEEDEFKEEDIQFIEGMGITTIMGLVIWEIYRPMKHVVELLPRPIHYPTYRYSLYSKVGCYTDYFQVIWFLEICIILMVFILAEIQSNDRRQENRSN